MSRPLRVDESLGRRPGETANEWFEREFGPIPAPTALDSTPDPTPAANARLRRASASLERSIPPAYSEARLDAPELSERVYGPAIGVGKSACHSPRVCLMGSSRAGKTSLGVAMLRAWVAHHERGAVFVAAHRLGVARIQHPAGRGEAELVEAAMTAPLVLLDDLGSERDFPTNPIADVIFERHAQDLPTWMTTGLTRQPLVARYGAGVVARLFERAHVIHVGPSDSKNRHHDEK
jgi:hypothetical protein